MHSEVFVQSVLVPLFLILLCAVEDTLLQSVSQVGGVCKLSAESSLRRCQTPDGKICSGRGKCDCGICVCQATEPGKFFGPRCECHDWVCAAHNGKTCNGINWLFFHSKDISSPGIEMFFYPGWHS
ncbi:hypothetical protein LDENG_00170860 [Lucifuga dentata]|nr:hypothetical protein LDENG_00170860 [Lucifuga dentata]